jgi:D-alanyl-D-alanine carboxypeptidase (penicillin-binding protein 5/6)
MRVWIILSGFLLMALILPTVGRTVGQEHAPPAVRSGAAVLMERSRGEVIFEANPGQRFLPASLAKVMTLYLAFDALKRGDVHFGDTVVVSKRAWKMGGSQMFLEVGDRVAFGELIKATAAISANDGAMAIAEFLAGSEEAFVRSMNEKAASLGMRDTRFVNPHGLPRPGQYTTAADMARLGFHYVHAHPEALRYHVLPTVSYGGIKQRNKNSLLRRDPWVDGVKTGYLRASGYHIIFSVRRDGRGLIGVVLGADTVERRNNVALELIDYGLAQLENGKP